MTEIETVGLDDLKADYGRWLIHGPQGSGKTTLAATIAEVGKTLFIDLTGEKGVRAIQGQPGHENIQVARPQSVTELDDIFWLLNANDHPYRAVVIDSLTALQKMTMRFLLGHDETAVREIRQGTAPADIRTWGQSLDVMTDTATFWFGLADGTRTRPMHVIMTAQTKIVEDEASGIVARTPDVQRGALSITLAAPDYIVYTDVEENLDHLSDPSLPAVHHIVRFGANPEYRTKARLPYHLRGKMPSILGRKEPATLPRLSQVLGIGGVPAKKAADASTKKAATVAAGK
jgi:hypothetical protein